MRFFYPWVLILLLVFPPFFIWYYFFSNMTRSAALRYSDVKRISASQSGINKYFDVLKYLDALKIIALVFIILTLARPQAGQKGREVIAEGYDIIIALDDSGSMLGEDFKPNRLEVAKSTIQKFIKMRKSDRIGLVVYAGESFTMAPLTLDYNMIIQGLKHVDRSLIEEDGTAIGMALANCVNRLRYSKAKSKVIILVTDGINNRGTIDPITAASIAQAMDIKIYTIGVGSKSDRIPVPVYDPIFGKRYQFESWAIDEDSMTHIADITGGKYFRAIDAQALEEVYNTINKLEKTKIKVKEYTSYNEMFYIYLGIAIILLLLYVVLRYLIFMTIP